MPRLSTGRAILARLLFCASAILATGSASAATAAGSTPAATAAGSTPAATAAASTPAAIGAGSGSANRPCREALAALNALPAGQLEPAPYLAAAACLRRQDSLSARPGDGGGHSPLE